LQGEKQRDPAFRGRPAEYYGGSAIAQGASLDGAPPPPHHPGMSGPAKSFELTADILLRAYSIGLFPMAESSDAATLFWVDPTLRGIFPLDDLMISRSLAKTVRRDRYEVRADGCFDEIVAACADRDKTWINAEIRRLYGELFQAGHAHSIAVYERGALVGGLYGVCLGAAFFGESMFHIARDASKVALVHLVARLRRGGFVLLDTQFVTPHLASLGAVEVTREQYLRALEGALEQDADFDAWPVNLAMTGAQALAGARGEGG
jgi:leucyl/phenylalanyl-tRNA---protein transferase